ncbi:hypothetical protein ACLPJF_05920 [Pseudomonas vlassakiae]|uniref:hypothetical protein n=1 Tax=Pseudomonas vlassakiae TaxID=485888 RepID=UPI003D2D2DFE
MTRNLFGTLVFIIFPGYFLYHGLRSFFDIPYLGWYTLSLIAAVVLIQSSNIYALLTRPSRISMSSLIVSSMFWMLILLMGGTVAINHTLVSRDYITTSGLIWSISIIIWMIGFYGLGQRFDARHSRYGGMLFFLLTISYAVLTYILYSPDSGTIDFLSTGEDLSNLANYQGAARSVLYTGLIFIPFISSKTLKSLYFFSYCAILYFIGSRSDLYLMIAILPFFVLITYGIYSVFAISLSVAICVIVVLVGDFKLGSRYSADIASDPSLLERHSLMVAGWEGITSNPIIGDYLGQVRDFGGVGYYIHNALSMWQAFGIIPFFIYCSLIIIAVIVSTMMIANHRKSAFAESLFYISITSLIAVSATKSITWALPALAWGMLHNYYSKLHLSKSVSAR